MSASCQVMAEFDSMAKMHHAVERLQSAGIGEYEVYSPVLHHEELEAHMPRKGSLVRHVAAVGGVTGTVAGFAVAALSSLLYLLITGGKAPVALVPFVVIMFELTILFAALATVGSLVYFARLRPLAPPANYNPRFSDDRFGVYVTCEPARREQAAELLRAAGAVEVSDGSVGI